MRRLLAALSALLALTLLLPTFAVAQEATPAAPALARTNIRYVSPFTPDGLNPGLTGAATEEGACGFASSQVLSRPDAWDCISDSGQIYDPCFENPFPAEGALPQVACFDSPFSADVVVLNLTEPLTREKETPDIPAAGGPHDELAPWDLPWALDLGNGEQCTLFGGTLTVVAGQVAHYGCTGGGMVLGETDRGQPIWVVNFIAEGEYATTLVDVITAWS